MTIAPPTQQPRRRGGAAAEAAVPPVSGPIAAPTKSRRRPAIIAIGIAVAIVGGLGTVSLYSAASRSQSYLVTKDSVARGATITGGDLSTINIVGGQSGTAIPASDTAQLIGHVATVDLPAGSLLTTKNTASELPLAAGKSIVGISLTAAQMPSVSMSSGQQVRIVDTPVSQGDPPTTEPESFEAEVFDTKADPTGKSNTIVDLLVTSSQAADIAARAATGRIALVIDGGR